MKTSLRDQISLLNPWLDDPSKQILSNADYVPRLQDRFLENPEWDRLWTVLVGPRQAGKTTMGKHLCQRLIAQDRFKQLLYLNCDLLEIREWLVSLQFIREAIDTFKLERPILFIDEVQRLENPGLLLKAIHDLQLPIKLIASGSSQLEIKSTVQEFLTGRHIECVVLPFSYQEIGAQKQMLEPYLLYGAYPSVWRAQSKEVILGQLYQDYITKDIIEILRIGKPDVMQKLIALLAHGSGQLINYEQLANDTRLSVPTLQNYMAILEQTYVIRSIRPFVGNMRTELTSNPICYFIDNGFRNQALRNFLTLEQRTDAGLLVEGAVFQEILKHQAQMRQDFQIHYWRTKGGAEVDFVLYKDENRLLPIEAKYRNDKRPKVTRGFRSFIEAYKPKTGIFITKALADKVDVNGCMVHFIPLERMGDMLKHVDKL